MADTTYRGNLTAACTPAVPHTLGRTIINKGVDQAYAPQASPEAQEKKDAGIPIAYYLKNVLPTDVGFASVTFNPVTTPCTSTPHTIFYVRDATREMLVSHSEDGFFFKIEGGVFTSLGEFDGAVTYASVSGVTYIFFAGIGCYVYNFDTGVLDSVTLNGLDPTQILGVTGSQGYLIAWSADTIVWSSVTDPTDFVPSLETGAGGGSVEGARGAITVAVPNSLGLFVFTEQNCVSCLFSNNARYPFNFKEIVGSGGLASSEAVTFDANLASAFAFTSVGFQQITHQAAKGIWTDLYDTGGAAASYDETTAFTDNPGRSRLEDCKVVSVAARYICISAILGVADHYEHCWIYDATLQRWGKLEIEHHEIFDLDGDIAVVDHTHRVLRVVDTSDATEFYPESDPILVLGKFQHSRGSLLTLQGIELENLQFHQDSTTLYTDNLPCKVYTQTSLNGRDGEWAEAYRADNIRYLARRTGINHSVMIKGNFNLNTIVLTYHKQGGR